MNVVKHVRNEALGNVELISDCPMSRARTAGSRLVRRNGAVDGKVSDGLGFSVSKHFEVIGVKVSNRLAP